MNAEKDNLNASQMDKRDKGIWLIASIFIALLFHVSGIIGMKGEHRDWFIAHTPINLVLMTILVVINERFPNKKFIIFGAIAFVTGMVVEIIGVQTGLLFGDYAYGTVMGIKFAGVPILIGLLWFVTVFGAGHLTQIVLGNRIDSPFVKAVIAALITTLFDVILEPGAISLGYWSWFTDNGDVPFYNYICWFLTSLILHVVFFKYYLNSERTGRFTASLLVIQMIFFVFLLM
jgi:putative membrane protein